MTPSLKPNALATSQPRRIDLEFMFGVSLDEAQRQVLTSAVARALQVPDIAPTTLVCRPGSTLLLLSWDLTTVAKGCEVLGLAFIAGVGTALARKLVNVLTSGSAREDEQETAKPALQEARLAIALPELGEPLSEHASAELQRFDGYLRTDFADELRSRLPLLSHEGTATYTLRVVEYDEEVDQEVTREWSRRFEGGELKNETQSFNVTYEASKTSAPRVRNVH